MERGVRLHRFVYLAAGLAVLLFAGLVYAWSILAAPIAADFPAWSGAALSLTFTICMSCFCVGALLAGILSRRIPVRFNIIISAALFLAGFTITSRVETLGALYAGYGVLCGLASGFAYNAVISTIPALFPDNTALVSGILLMGFGTSALLMGTAFTLFTPEGAGMWRQSFFLMGIVTASVFLIAFILFPSAGKPGDKTVAQESSAEAKGRGSPSNTAANNEFPPVRMLKEFNFYVFFFWLIFVSAAGLALISQARSIVVFVRPETGTAVVSLIVGMISVCNGLGRIIFGSLFDTLGSKRAMLAVNILLLAAGLLLLVALKSGIFLFLLCGFILLGIDYGGGPLMCAAYTRKVYGSKYFPLNFSIANMNLLAASFSSAFSGMLFDYTRSYISMMLFLTIIGILAMVLLCRLNRN
jgi:OFA family oxalate/formate antiporter-like MFS transporter